VDLKHKEAVVVAFTCNHCPIAIEYYERMNEFATKHCGTGGKVALVAISVSNLETDKLPRMKELSQRRTLQFPYLHDQTQRAAKDFGATTTPQFCVLDQDRILVYRGAWDDDLNPTKVRNRYIEDAVTAVLKRQRLAVNETKAVGCPIDYE
jgi:peroxiredoxin